VDIDNDELEVIGEEITPEQWERMRKERLKTDELPKLKGTGSLYDVLRLMREAYITLRYISINEKHTRFLPTLDIFDHIIQDFVMEVNDVEDEYARRGLNETKAKDTIEG